MTELTQDTTRPEFFAVSRAAAMAGISAATLRRYCDEGLLQPIRTHDGARLFRMADIEQAKHIRNMRRR